MSTFKVGGMVKCIRPELGRNFLKFGATYEVEEVVSELHIKVVGSAVAFLNNRFVKSNNFKGNIK